MVTLRVGGTLRWGFIFLRKIMVELILFVFSKERDIGFDIERRRFINTWRLRLIRMVKFNTTSKYPPPPPIHTEKEIEC